jgi:Tfp pilus assembly protein PilN
LRQINAELISDMSQCRAKESELLAYTQKVTEKNVFLQSEFSATEGKNALLEQEIERLRNQIEKITIDTKNRIEMERERQCHAQNEKKLLTEELETQKQQIVSLQEKLDYLIGEGELFKRRHETSLRELTKELQTAVRMSGDEISRTSSSTSINSLSKPDDDLNHQKKNTESPSESEAPAIPDQQILVEKIIQLRKLLLKKDEKIEFIQGMNKDLVEQLQKKSKLVNCFLMNQEVGTLSTDISDQNKAEAMKRGGLMASLYGGKNSDQLLTLDLSLRINQQLQSLLEDTILKNLKLKENIDTLSSQLEMKNARK